jgi:hypothetical protein
MKLGLLLHDPEEEHDWLSDITPNSHYYDIVGMQAVIEGRYERVDGGAVQGASLLSRQPDDAVSDVNTKLKSTLSAAAREPRRQRCLHVAPPEHRAKNAVERELVAAHRSKVTPEPTYDGQLQGLAIAGHKAKGG